MVGDYYMKILAVNHLNFVGKVNKNNNKGTSSKTSSALGFDTVELSGKIKSGRQNMQLAAYKARAGRFLNEANAIFRMQSKLYADEIDINTDALGITMKGKEIARESQAIYDEAIETFCRLTRSGKTAWDNDDPSQEWTKRDMKVAKGSAIIRDYDEYDEIIREIEFSKGMLTVRKMDENSGHWDVHIFNPKTGRLMSYMKNFTEFGNSCKMDEAYIFASDGHVVTYNQGFKMLPDKSQRVDRKFLFNQEGALQEVCVGSVVSQDGSFSFDKQYVFNNSALKKYTVGLKAMPKDHFSSCKKEYNFDDFGDLTSCVSDLRTTAELIYAGKIHIFDGSNLDQVYSKYYYYDFVDKSTDVDEIYTYGPNSNCRADISCQGKRGEEYRVLGSKSTNSVEFKI